MMVLETTAPGAASRILAALFLAALLPGCSLWDGAERLSLRFPALPPAWEEALGPCSWSLRWYDEAGVPRSALCSGTAEIRVAAESAAPVLAYPYWPALGIPEGAAAPAGGLYPWAARDGELALDWTGGVEAVFFRALLYAPGGGPGPDLFDWPRFRGLLSGGGLPAGARDDPWTVDWRAAAAKTRAAGFDRRRLVPLPSSPLALSLPGPGPWAFGSPFAGAPEAGGSLSLSCAAQPRCVLSRDGLVVYSGGSWAFFPAPRPGASLVLGFPFE